MVISDIRKKDISRELAKIISRACDTTDIMCSDCGDIVKGEATKSFVTSSHASLSCVKYEGRCSNCDEDNVKLLNINWSAS